MTDNALPVDTGLTDFLHASMPFAGVLDVQAVSFDKEQVLAQISWAADKCTTGGIIPKRIAASVVAEGVCIVVTHVVAERIADNRGR